jgi:hypothetical protein
MVFLPQGEFPLRQGMVFLPQGEFPLRQGMVFLPQGEFPLRQGIYPAPQISLPLRRGIFPLTQKNRPARHKNLPLPRKNVILPAFLSIFDLRQPSHQALRHPLREIGEGVFGVNFRLIAIIIDKKQMTRHF